MANLKKGNRGVDVRRLQMLLNEALMLRPPLKEDGDYGAKTVAAVMRFQKLHRLTPDGIVGVRTWIALGQAGKTTTPPMPSQPALEPWLDIAKAEVGIHEDALPGQHTERILEYHKTTTLKATTDETPWCSSFVNWVLIKSGRKGTDNALARSWLDWGTALDTAREGAVTVIKKKNASSDAATGSATGFHVAFYIGSPTGAIRLLGGNQGDQVKYSSFSLASYDIKGFRWTG